MDDESAPQPRVVYVFFSFHYFTLAEIIVCKYLIRLSPPTLNNLHHGLSLFCIHLHSPFH